MSGAVILLLLGSISRVPIGTSRPDYSIAIAMPSHKSLIILINATNGVSIFYTPVQLTLVY